MNEPVAGVLDRPPVAEAPRPTRWRLAGLIRFGFGFVAVAGVAVGGYATRDQWWPVLFPVAKDTAAESDDHADAAPISEQILLTAQAQRNLRLTAKPLKAESFWKTISVPGIVIDRPGFSDRGVVAPVTAVVSRIHKASAVI